MAEPNNAPKAKPRRSRVNYKQKYETLITFCTARVEVMEEIGYTDDLSKGKVAAYRAVIAKGEA